jgi:hypothetical protein
MYLVYNCNYNDFATIDCYILGLYALYNEAVDSLKEIIAQDNASELIDNDLWVQNSQAEVISYYGIIELIEDTPCKKGLMLRDPISFQKEIKENTEKILKILEK